MTTFSKRPALLVVLAGISLGLSQQATTGLPGAWAQGTTSASTADDQAQPAIPEIVDTPRTVDPAQYLPEPLTKLMTVELPSSSLAELVEWLRGECGLTVLIQYAELADEQIHESDSVSDALKNEPVYLLLDRLGRMGIGWYFDGDVLYLTTRKIVSQRQVTTPYFLGSLLDDGYSGSQLLELVQNLVEPDSWGDNGGDGRINLIGDVMFARNTADVQRKIQGFLTAIPQPSRQTLVDVSTADLSLRDKLVQSITVQHRDTPLEEVVRDLAAQIQADIRLDRPALSKLRVRERQPVSMQIRDQPLKTVLDYFLPQLGLGWQIRDGVLWVTVPPQKDGKVTGLYDVRDLCRDDNEAQALIAAVWSQMPEVFTEDGGESVLDVGKPGTLIAWASPAEHASMLDLLEKYRFALRQSKLRKPAESEDAIKTLYYRLHANVAFEMVLELPQLVAPESWQSAERPEAIGTIKLLESTPEVIKGPAAETVAAISQRKVLIIRQRESVHGQIIEVLRRIENGDAETRGYGGMGGMGGMGGGMGFGGGMFAFPEAGR